VRERRKKKKEEEKNPGKNVEKKTQKIEESEE